MGYAYSVYGVDLAKLKAIRGCKDTKLAARIKKKHAERFTDSDDWFADSIAEGAPRLATALDEIIAGKPTHAQHGFQYGYATKLLCEHLGKRVDAESLDWFGKFLDPLLTKAKLPDTNTVLGLGTFPFKIPAPSDFPEIGTLNTKGIARLTRALDAIEPLAKTGSTAALTIAEVRGWLARANQRDIVWFLH